MVKTVPASTALRLSATTAIDVSIIIVSYNTREFTLRAVESILAHSDGVRAEIIVVDNCSSDGSATALREAFPGVIVVDSASNGGFAAGNNQGLELASGRYVLILNPDTQIRRDALRRSIDYMDANPAVGVLGARVWSEDGSVDPTIFRFLSLRQIAFSGLLPTAVMKKTSLFGDGRYAGLALDQLQDVDVVAGCFMLVRRSVLERVGGLDERFFMYGEESEWCHRIRSAGWIVRYHPEIEISHFGGASTTQLSVWRTVETAKGHILFLKITRGPLIARLGALLMLARDIARLGLTVVGSIARGRDPRPSTRATIARLLFAAGAVARLPQGQRMERSTHPSPRRGDEGVDMPD